MIKYRFFGLFPRVTKKPRSSGIFIFLCNGFPYTSEVISDEMRALSPCFYKDITIKNFL